MSKSKFINELNQKVNRGSEFINSLQYDNFNFIPAHEGLTLAGNELKLGFSCYGLKYMYMCNEWNNISLEDQNSWIKHITSFQKNDSKFPKNYFIDDFYIKHLNKFKIKKNSKELVKTILNFLNVKSYDSKNQYKMKSVNAETKQAISTLHEINYSNYKTLGLEFDNNNEMLNFLNNLDWSKPWSSGAQFSSLCVYSSTQNSYDKNELIKFVNSLVQTDSGFYYSNEPNNIREIFNGAMKIISGLDWLNCEIHYPKKIIDFCLNNRPIFEGCDFVDYIYILNRCIKQTHYRKREVINLFYEISSKMDLLYHRSVGGYSYFEGKSQTHYYGVQITNGLNTPDIHATLLCNWGNILILDTMEEIGNFKTLKP